MEGRWFHLEWLFNTVIWAKERELPTDMNQSKVYFIISYFHIFKHSNSSLSILKVSNIVIYKHFSYFQMAWMIIDGNLTIHSVGCKKQHILLQCSDRETCNI